MHRNLVIVALAFILLHPGEGYNIDPLTFEDKLKEAKIIPDVIDTAPNTTRVMEVWFMVSPFPYDLQLGNYFLVDHCKQPPNVSWERAEPGKKYLVAFIDPDSPSKDNPTERELLLWLFSDMEAVNVTSGVALAEYQAPKPALNTGEHRFIFILYELPAGSALPKYTGPRTGFKIRDYAQTHNLGKPVNVNYFMAMVTDTPNPGPEPTTDPGPRGQGFKQDAEAVMTLFMLYCLNVITSFTQIK